MATILAVSACLIAWPASAFAGGTDVAVTVLGAGTVTDDHGLQNCSSAGERVECGAQYYNTGWDVTFTATPGDSRWRFDRWDDNGPNKISCTGTSSTCSFHSGTCINCAFHDTISATFVPRDDDADGSNALVDCNDHSAAVHPGAVEVADGIDENCDGRPDTALTRVVPASGSVVAATSATFDFSSPPNPGWNASFQCKLDDGPWTDCTSPMKYPALADGLHTFQVAGADSDGLVDSSPATTTWTVDTTPPDTRILSGPDNGAITNATSTAFTFAAEPGDQFECSLDGAAFQACTGPGASHTVSHLSVSAHEFRVRAVDSAGNTDPTPASRTWVVTADADGDGYILPGDCNDNDPTIHPNATDVAHDGIDQNCDGQDNLDADGDGANAGPGPDCDDNNAYIHPGAFDTPGDLVDQNCDGHDATFPRLAPQFGAQWLFSPFRFTKLYVKRVAAGSRIEMRCRGRGCPFSNRTRVVPGARQFVSLLAPLKGARLRRGATLTIRITKAGYDGVMRRYIIQGRAQDPRVSDRCVPAQAGKAKSC